MKFEDALYKACRELNLDAHIKYIGSQDAYTYAEKIAKTYHGNLKRKETFPVKNSYMYLNSIDFCFFELEGKCYYSISGLVSHGERQKIHTAIETANELCEVTDFYMNGD